MKEIYRAIAGLTAYAERQGLITPDDRLFCRNALLERLHLDGFEEPDAVPELPVHELLKTLTDYAVQSGLCGDEVVFRDLFDSGLMSCLTPRPSEVRRTFREKYAQSPRTATDWYYAMSKATNYIRWDRIEKNLVWQAPTEYGDLDITVNLSKPEKATTTGAAFKAAQQAGPAYPKCLLCVENEGYAGRFNHPARQNHRIVPMELDGEQWYLQYSPYVYYNEHCIAFSGRHTPMVIDEHAFRQLLDFVTIFPHYFMGSNADLPIVGGSIFTHAHFQGGGYTFAMAKAPIEIPLTFAGYENVRAGIVKWPMSVIRIQGPDKDELARLAAKILRLWRGYTDEAANIFAETEGTPHSTITPIARRRGTDYEMDLVLRNNITTEDLPLGVYHPPPELHHIKKENIGLIEVMGLAVLPPRLKPELARVRELLLSGGDLYADPLTEKHADWAEELKTRYTFTEENAEEIIRTEVGVVFAKVLEHAGVYKRTPEGRAAFLRFTDYVNQQD